MLTNSAMDKSRSSDFSIMNFLGDFLRSKIYTFHVTSLCYNQHKN